MLVGVEEGRAPAARLTRGAPPRRTTTARLRACWASWRPRRAGRTRARPAAWARPRCRCRSCPCPAARPRPAACRCRPGPAATPPGPILCEPCRQTLAPGFGARPELDGEVHEPCRFGGRGALPGAGDARGAAGGRRRRAPLAGRCRGPEPAARAAERAAGPRGRRRGRAAGLWAAQRGRAAACGARRAPAVRAAAPGAAVRAAGARPRR